MTPERKRQAEEASKKYYDAAIKTAIEDGYDEDKQKKIALIAMADYFNGWCDADSTPAPSEVGDEEFIKAECSKFNENGWGADITEKGIRLGLAHARRTQNAEVERLKKVVKNYSEMSLSYMAQIQELSSLLEKFKEMTEHALTLGHLGEGSTKGWAQGCLSDYEKLIGKK